MKPKTSLFFRRIASVRAALFFTILAGVLQGCNLLDPSQVNNPQITATSLAENSTGGAAGLLVGLQRRFSNAVAVSCTLTETTSDNYANTTSFVSENLANPRLIVQTDLTLNSTDPAGATGGGGIYYQLQRAKALADFGLLTVVPADAQVTPAQVAEIRWYRAMALIVLAENFSAFPITDQGQVITSKDAFTEAVKELQTALALLPATGEVVNRCRLALARAYRMLGDKTNAAKFATDLLAAAPNYLYLAQFDNNSALLTSDFATMTVIRTDNNFQPLPRLDFLDPKYSRQDAPIPVLKAEEAHLILAEIALSNGDAAGARAAMTKASTLARSRNKSLPVPYSPTDTLYVDKDNRRGIRPNNSGTVVRADANSPYIPGLVQRRSGSTVNLYPISFTNQTADSIAALASQAASEHVYMLYLLRQHIFFGEARRMSDLGIRLPVMLRESETNPNQPVGSPGTLVIVPDYIPQGDELDRYSPAPVGTATQVTILWDMNRVLTSNIKKVSPLSGF